MSTRRENEIPLMTDPMGNHWDQPDVVAIEVDDTHALMSRQTFEKLPEYSCTFPSGVYPGKMWRRHDGVHDPRCKPSDRRWLLCWYGFSDMGEGYCSTNSREILISDELEAAHANPS